MTHSVCNFGSLYRCLSNSPRGLYSPLKDTSYGDVGLYSPLKDTSYGDVGLYSPLKDTSYGDVGPDNLACSERKFSLSVLTCLSASNLPTPSVRS